MFLKLVGGCHTTFSRQRLFRCWREITVVSICLLAIQPGNAEEPFAISCITAVVPNVGDMGKVLILHEMPRAGTLIAAENGLFLARPTQGTVRFQPVDTPPLGGINYISELSGAGTLIGAKNGLFVARLDNGNVKVEPVGTRYIGEVLNMHNFPGAGILIQTLKGWILAREVNGQASLEPAGADTVRLVFKFHEVVGAGMFILTSDGLLLARWAKGKLVVEAAGTEIMGTVFSIDHMPDSSMLIGASKGFFTARMVDGILKVNQIASLNLVSVMRALEFPGGDTLIETLNGLFVARLINGQVNVETFGKNLGLVLDIYEFPTVGVFIDTSNGLYLARAAKPEAIFEKIRGGLEKGGVRDIFQLKAGEVLFGSAEGLFLGRLANNKVTLEQAGDIGPVFKIFKLDGADLLIQGSKGVFLTRDVDHKAKVTLANAIDIGDVNLMHELPGAGKLINTSKGWFLSVRSSLASARVVLTNSKTLDGMPPDQTRPRDFRFVIEHPCSSSLETIDLAVEITGPGMQRSLSKREQKKITTTSGFEKAEVSILAIADKPGPWKFQLLSLLGGREQRIGNAQVVQVAAQTWREVLQTWGWWLGGGLAAALALLNVGLFIAARRSAWAWRIATDNALGTVVLRFGTAILSYFPWAQLWILDFYFQKNKGALNSPPPFLSLPLDRGTAQESSDEVMSPPWQGRRVWIQGNSGMGKTALFIHATAAHFRDSASSFDAFRKYGCIVVAFAARDFADGSDDKLEPDWVIEGIKATLAQAGLTFDDNKLLQRILESGTVAVAIDGLHEADRTKAVEAFVRAFDRAPILVTSQVPGGKQFTTWRLPTDMRAFTNDLLHLYLSDPDANIVMNRLATSGLTESIRSGYDVRLVVDLVRAAPQYAPLPTNRVGLYAAVVDEAWPAETSEVLQEQQMQTAAAAWNMVSERKPNEDIRRIRPDIDLGRDILVALAEAPERYGKSVRLIRRVGGSFEFVHDQMHAYLAARWFTKDGGRVQELEIMVAASKIWTHPLPARHTLWNFVAILLDDARLLALWECVENREEWDVLRRELKKEAESRGLTRRS